VVLSCSTCWNAHRHREGEDILSELESLGFRHVELSHGLRMSQITGITKYLEKKSLRVSSLHNFCPQPIEVLHDSPDCLEYTSYDPAERRRAVKITKETIHFASRVGAPVVVLHLGSLPHSPFEDRLAEMAKGGLLHEKKAINLKLDALRKRAKSAHLFWDRIHSCLQEIVPFAQEKKIRLGVECRSSALDFPMEDEFDFLWGKYPPETVGYWHDFGHMQRKHNLLLGNHWEALSKQRGRIFGAHVHDTVFPVRDHRAVGTGSIDWPLLLQAVPSNLTWVLELSPRATVEDVRVSAEKLSQWLTESSKKEISCKI